VTPLLSKDLTEFPGKEGAMLIVEYPPGSTDPIHRHNAHGFIYLYSSLLGFADRFLRRMG
jgi:quercetin dioxygenase-like cupin family protein